MLLNSWLKSFRSLCDAQNPAKRMRRRSEKRRNAPSTSRNPAEVLEQRSLLTTFTVNSLADTPDAIPGDGVAVDANGETSFRAALEEANALTGADVIEFNDGSGPGVNFHDATADTITLGGTQLQISSEVIVNGPGADLLRIDANDQSRVLAVTGSAVAEVKGARLANGNGPTNGGILTNGGTLKLQAVEVVNGTASLRGGGIFNGGMLTVVDSTIAGNDALVAGGGVFSNSNSVVDILNSTVSGNSSPGMSGMFGNGGGFRSEGAATVVNSTVVNNSSNNPGGGIQRAAGSLVVQNSIVSGNTANVGADNVVGGLDPASSNNLINQDISTILITSLAFNGGSTRTHALRLGSSAIDAGDNALAFDENGDALTADQRGFVSRATNGTVDIGAYEFGAIEPEAASLVVTTDADIVDQTDFLTSLREALAFANSNPDSSEITFGDGSGLTGGADFTDGAADTVTLDGSRLVIATSTTISGTGSDLLTIDGDNQFQVFDINNAGNVVISDLTIANGNSTSINSSGGAINNGNSNVSVINSVLVGNRGNVGGGVRNEGQMRFLNSLLTENISVGSGGGIYNGLNGVLTVTNTTLTGNRGNSTGGGIFNAGDATIVNSTLAGNRADGGGGISYQSTTRLRNSVVAGNIATDRGQDVFRVGGNGNAANSLIGDGGNNPFTDGVNGNIVDVDWMTVLENDGTAPTLADNGGLTMTIALVPLSSAINAGDDARAVDADTNALTTDQRGDGFNRFVGTVDIGAFEVQNQAPTADAGGPYAVAEGSDVSLNGAGSSDPENDTLTYEWDYNFDGTTFDVDATGETPDFTGIDDGDVTVALRVSDGTELSEIVTTTVTVSNADPAISGLTTDSATVASKSDDGVVTLSGSVTDAGTLDTHEVVVEWGDGNVETIVAAGDLVASPDFWGTEHTYAAGGIYTITVTVTDDDGDSVTETTSAVVQGVGVVDGVLYVIGTNSDDVAELREKNHGTQLRVKTKFDGGSTNTEYFDIADIDRIEMHLCDGDDYAGLTHAHWWHKHSVDIPATINGGDGDDVLIGGSQADVIDGGNGDDCLHGESGDDTIHGGDGHDWIDGGWGDDIVYAGAGNDWVWGGFGNDILLGQSGNDRLFGGWGRDIIIAGEGADFLFGQGQDDILITGDTNWDDDEDALKTMRDVWTGSGSAYSRAQAIHDSGLEVIHDDDVDKVWGGWGRDWLLFDGDLDRAYC